MPHSLLKQKLFYFITDVESNITFFVNNKSKERFVYYPYEYQTMKSYQIERSKRSMVFQMLWFSLFDKKVMTKQDRQTCRSKVIDIAVLVGCCLILAHFSRIILFKTKIRSFERNLTGQIISSKWVKTVIAYSIAFFCFKLSNVTSVSYSYLFDLAYEYQYPIRKGKIFNSQIDQVFQELSAKRFDQYL